MTKRISLIALWSAILITSAATGGCGDGGGDGGSENQPAAVAQAPSTPTALSVSPQEEAYLNDVHDKVPETDSDNLAVINAARETCGMRDRQANGRVDEYDPLDERYPPSLDSLIEDRPDRSAQLAIKHLCPKYLPILKRARSGFGEGPQDIGREAKPGTYRTVSGMTKDLGTVQDCYWERSTKNGKTIANDFVTNAPRGVVVTIAATDGGFTSRGCGNWVPAHSR